jgi:tRNA (guanine-N7-)-methyltransferase
MSLEPLDSVSVMPVQPSPAVRSSQSGIHPRLTQVVDLHLSRPWRQPLHRPTCSAFGALAGMIDGCHQRLILDAGCGNGLSTRALARDFPDCLVLGVDKSEHRLTAIGAPRFPHREGNAVFLRADLPTFWRLARAAGWRLHRHYLLYPNPWPKPGQLRRRWYAHPVFPDLLALGGRLEMRCNWHIYALEFAAAVNRALGVRVSPEPVETDIGSPFERKYRRSGHTLYSVVATC